MIDLRSDTLTKPTPGMLEAMFKAEVGDDVFGEDPTVTHLENKVARLFGKEAALFCTSGTQTNQIAIMAQTKPGDEILCHEHAHIYLYEGGGLASNSHLAVKLLKGDRGRLDLETIMKSLSNPNDLHQPNSSIVSVENTMNKGGGSIYELNELKKISEFCKKNNLVFHLDGARLFNALISTSQTASEHGAVFDSISICLSKGLGAPVGSLIVGSTDLILKCRRIRKRLGGGWRQAGYLAAAGIYALDNHVERLKIDHQNAQEIADIFKTKSYIKNIMPVETNIVIVELQDDILQDTFLNKLNEAGIKAVGFGPQLIRFVTHLDFKPEELQDFKQAVTALPF